MRQFTPDEKIQNARLDLAVNMPFFGSVFLRLNAFEDPTCKTAWTDGISIGYNLDYLGSLPHMCIIGLFVHEVLHVILKHHLRVLDNANFKSQPRRYNCAADYALNPMIKRTDGMDIMPSWLYDPKWDDSLAEHIFYELADEDSEEGKATYGDAGDQPGEVRPWPGEGGKPTDVDIDVKSQEIDQWVKAAEFKATGAGKIDGNVKQIIGSVTASTVCWTDELHMLAEDLSKTDYTWMKPNPRYMQNGIYLPSLTGRKSVDMVFYVDTSGSLSKWQLSKIGGEVQEIVQLFNIRVIVVYWDTGFKAMEVFEPGDVLDPEWRLDVAGRGGTNFTSCWDWLDENSYDLDFEPKAIVFFSDLECSKYPKNEPDLPLIWCQVPNSGGGFQNRYIQYLPEYGKHVKVPVYKEAN